MRIIIAYLLILAVFIWGASASLIRFVELKSVSATEILPTDLAIELEKFEVRVGFDQELGRYYSYHYEF